MYKRIHPKYRLTETLTLGTHRAQLVHLTLTVWPLPCLERPPFLLFLVYDSDLHEERLTKWLTHHLWSNVVQERLGMRKVYKIDDQYLSRPMASTRQGKEIHLLPCKIDCTCDNEEKLSCNHSASVSTFFEPVILKTGTQGMLGTEYSATLRGRPLCGTIVPMTEGCIGQVLHKCKKTFSEARK